MDDMLSSILNDPEKLKSAISMATSMLGGGGGAQPADEEPPMPDPAPPAEFDPPSGPPSRRPPAGGIYDPSAELMQKAMPVLAQIARSGQNAVSPEKLELLSAVKPFVAGSVGAQIDHGLRLVSLARMARAAMKQFGAEQNEGVTHV